MRRAIPLITACLLTLIAAGPLFAQQRLFALNDEQLVEIDPRLPSLGGILRSFSFPDDVNIKEHLFPFLGGAYLVWANGGHVSLLDTRSGAIQQFTPADFVPQQIVGTDGNTRLLIGSGLCMADSTFCIASPAHARILVADVRSGSQRVLDLGPSHMVGRIAYAAASDLLFVAKARRESPVWGVVFGVDFFDVDVIQMSSGAVLKTLDLGPLDTYELRTNPAGTWLLVNQYRAFDVVTGALTGSIASVPASAALVVDDQRYRVIFGGEQLQAFSIDSLSPLGTTGLPSLPRIPGATTYKTQRIGGDTDVSGQSATIFLARGRFLGTSDCHSPQLAAIDADTGRVRALADASSFLSRYCSVDLIRITEPAAPLGLTVRTSGHQVTLEWQAALNATSYEMEAGSAPGLANLATINENDTHLVVDGVPTGTYHLRVRAINIIGKSGASQEVQVIVP